MGALRVMIVDDNVDAAAMLATLVQTWGHQVGVAHSAHQAVRLAAEFRPRVVLLDLGLPDRHGYDLAQQLRREAGSRRIFFVAVTGWNQIADQVRSAAAGIAHHLMKPVNHDLLREILAAYTATEDPGEVRLEA